MSRHHPGCRFSLQRKGVSLSEDPNPKWSKRFRNGVGSYIIRTSNVSEDTVCKESAENEKRKAKEYARLQEALRLEQWDVVDDCLVGYVPLISSALKKQRMQLFEPFDVISRVLESAKKYFLKDPKRQESKTRQEFVSWILIITRCRHIDMCRKRERQNRPRSRVAVEGLGMNDPDLDTDSRREECWLLSTLFDIRNNLKPDDRKIFRLYELGKNSREIGEELGRKDGYVRLRKKRVRERVQRKLQKSAQVEVKEPCLCEDWCLVRGKPLPRKDFSKRVHETE